MNFVRPQTYTRFAEKIKLLLRGDRLILASSSPRRAQMLAELGLSFFALRPRLVEEDLVIACPKARSVDLSGRKAASVLPEASAGLVLGADTSVVRGGEILGKPKDHHEAFEMLHRLSGQWHEVYTGLSLVAAPSGAASSGWECTRVKFRALTARAIHEYIASGEPFDKAGAYGIQGLGGALVEGIEGDYENVIGLPVATFAFLLEQLRLTGPPNASVPGAPHGELLADRGIPGEGSG